GFVAVRAGVGGGEEVQEAEEVEEIDRTVVVAVRKAGRRRTPPACDAIGLESGSHGEVANGEESRPSSIVEFGKLHNPAIRAAAVKRAPLGAGPACDVVDSSHTGDDREASRRVQSRTAAIVVRGEVIDPVVHSAAQWGGPYR